MRFYPQPNAGSLVALATIKGMMEQDEAYLDDDACPYDNDTKKSLRDLLAPKLIEVPVEKIIEKIVEVNLDGGKKGAKVKPKGSSSDVIGKELHETLVDLRSLKLNSKTLLPADRVTVLKAQAALLEKLITLEERNTNVKKMSNFMSITMGILDDLVEEDKRQTFMKRIAPYTEQE